VYETALGLQAHKAGLRDIRRKKVLIEFYKKAFKDNIIIQLIETRLLQ
jgi:hypothetical protein